MILLLCDGDQHLPGRDNMSADLQELYAVADDYEANVLDNLRISAGQLWECPGCQRWVLTRNEESRCAECGQQRPEPPRPRTKTIHEHALERLDAVLDALEKLGFEPVVEDLTGGEPFATITISGDWHLDLSATLRNDERRDA